MLGLPVTGSLCTLAGCGKTIAPDGQHAIRHCQGKSIARHNGVRDAVAGLFRLWNRRGDMDLECSVEVNLSSLGYRRKTPDAGERRADFCLENVMTGTHIFADVRIVHQDTTASATVKDPYADLEAVYKQKMANYKEAFELETAWSAAVGV